MSRSRILFFFLSSLAILTVVGGSLLGAVRDEDGDDSLYKYLTVFTDVLGLIRDSYVDRIEVDALMAGALDATTEALDPFSLYVPPEQVPGFLAAQEIGDRRSGLILLKDRGIAFVPAVIPGSPAAEAGVEGGDIVAEIDGRSTRLMPLWEIQEILAGEPGTSIDLQLLRAGERVDLSLTLGSFTAPAVELEALEGASLLHVGGLRPGGAAEVEKALADATRRGVRHLLIDLRGVAGGDPATAYEIAGLFTRGPLGTLDRRGETLARFASDEPAAWQGRLVVLTDRGTLGAAEILATVLRQSAGAELVGERTFGHAGRQEVAELSSGGRLLYTGAFYTGPDGEILEESLEPDVRVSEASRSFEEKDIPLRELILKRGLSHLLGEEQDEERQAA